MDKAFYIFCHYMLAVASRDIVDMMKIISLLAPLRDALDELASNEYVIWELFFRDETPTFISIVG